MGEVGIQGTTWLGIGSQSLRKGKGCLRKGAWSWLLKSDSCERASTWGSGLGNHSVHIVITHARWRKCVGWESGSYNNLLKYRKIDQISKDIKDMVISVILISVEGVKIWKGQKLEWKGVEREWRMLMWTHYFQYRDIIEINIDNMYAYVYEYMFMNMCKWLWICVFICVYVYMYINPLALPIESTWDHYFPRAMNTPSVRILVSKYSSPTEGTKALWRNGWF